MKRIPLAGCGLIMVVLAVWQLAPRVANAPAAAAQPSPVAPLEVPGRTRCMLAHRGIIASAILRPVVNVMVAPGDHVKKGQPLIKLYDLEPRAKVLAREKELKSIEAKARFSRRNLDLAERAHGSASLPERTYNDISATALSYEADVLAAAAELSLAEAELKLYTIMAPIDGEIAWLDVSLGTVSWPGSLIWGEIVDLRELDVRCDLSSAQAERVSVGQSAEIRLDGKPEPAGTGKVVFIGKMADRNTGLVPVVVRMSNPDQRLRAEVPVKIRFQPEQAK
jgi:HlyD family secretion protein